MTVSKQVTNQRKPHKDNSDHNARQDPLNTPRRRTEQSMQKQKKKKKKKGPQRADKWPLRAQNTASTALDRVTTIIETSNYVTVKNTI